MTPSIDTEKLTRWYDLQAPFYRLWRNSYDSPLVARTASIVRTQTDPRRILDAGCGTGLFSIALAAALPASRVTAVDLSAGMLAVASEQARTRSLSNLTFARADVAGLPFVSGSFDVVVAAGLLPNVNDRPAVLRELGRVLAPRGRLIVVEFDRQAMTLAVRWFFRVMILGYRSVSFFFRRYRFADRWTLVRSTVALDELEDAATQAGLRVEAHEALTSHMIIELKKGIAR
jgi:ubiquinone/menaquinone biosynthesis C-methylase UbiE